MAMGVCQILSALSWIAALTTLPLVNAYAISFLTPMAVAFLGALVLKEPLGWRRALPSACGFLGVLIAINPTRLALSGSETWIASLILFGRVFVAATQMILLRNVGHHETRECVAFYPRIFTVLAGICLCSVNGFVRMDPPVFLALCAAGALAGAGWTLLSESYKNATATSVAPVQYVQILLGALLGYALWGDVPDIWLLSGAGVIVASGLYLVRHERRMSRMMVRAE